MTILYNIFKAAEGGIGQKWAIQMLKDAGIKARPSTSVYVGQTAVLVEGGKRIQDKTSKILYGRQRID